MTDVAYVPPKGFATVNIYPDATPPFRRRMLVQTGGLQFDLSISIPALPLIACGEAWHVGWDIPTRWAIGFDGGCWMDSAHGGFLTTVSVERMLHTIEEIIPCEAARRALGLAMPEPDWMLKARAAGWNPPDSLMG